jgi:hypothetical protein
VRGTAFALGATALAAFAATQAWAYATSDFWEAQPAITCAIVTGLLAALAVYASRRRFGLALLVGVPAGFATLIVALFVTLARWEG